MPFTITSDHLSAIAGKLTLLMPDLSIWMNKICPGYGIDTPQEYAHFLAQACHETAAFSTLREFGSDSYFKRYDAGTKIGISLGNTFPGDGLKFKGRGIFQTTGRFNYKKLSITKGNPELFIKNPELLEKPEFAIWSACEFWKDHRFTDTANHADTDLLPKKMRLPNGQVVVKNISPIEYISRSINGGDRGLAERIRYYTLAKTVLV